MNPETFHGREHDRAVVSARSGVVPVSGDSGIGKSSFLASLRAECAPGEVVAEVQLLRSATGSLQYAIATALGDCLLHSATDETRQRLVWGRVKDAVLRAATVTQKELGRILVTRATEVVESKIGKEATAVIRKVVDEILLPPKALLEQRLEAFTAPDTAAILGLLVRDVAAATEQTLVIPLDSAERLGREDRDLLVELATEVRDDLRLVVSVNNQHAEGRELIRLLAGRDSTSHELAPLSHEEVEEWLLAEEVHRNQWLQVVRIADGYPLFVKDAIKLAKAGMSLSSIKTPTSFQSVFEYSFRQLGAGMQHQVTRLAAFTDPPPHDYLERYLSMTASELLTLERKLLDDGVFILRPDGATWFHDRRRAYLWDTRLSEKQRQSVASDVLESFKQRLEQESYIEGWLAVSTPAIIAETDPDRADIEATRFIDLDTNLLGLVAAMVELIEPQQNPTAHTREIAAYASRRFGYSGDPISDLETLHERGMIGLASNTNASLASPVIPTNFAYAVLIGEVQRRFGVQLTSGRALRSFDAYVKPYLLPFDRAIISLQRGTLAKHSATFHEAVMADKSREQDRSRAGLGITLMVDDQPLSVTVLFGSSWDRDAARASLAANIHSSPVRNHIQIDRIDDLPATRIRFGRLQQLLEAHDLRRKTVAIASESNLVELLNKRALVAEVLASSLDDYEATAYGLNQRRRYILDNRGVPESAAVFEIETPRSAPTVTATVVSDVPLLDDPLIELRLRAQGLIGGEERLVRWTLHAAIRDLDDAVTETINDFIDKGRRFNRNLPKIPVQLDQGALAEQIRQEGAAVRGLERDLVERGVLDRRLESRKDSLLVLLDCATPSETRWYPWGASTFWLADGKAEVRVLVLSDGEEPPSIFTRGEELRKFGIDTSSGPIRSGGGIASSTLSGLLGYESEDIAIRDPRFPEYR